MNDNLDMKLDSQFDKIETLSWLPFIGKDYWSNDKRTLIVGESHYVPIDENFEDYSHKTWTREFILKEGLQIVPWNQNNLKNPLTREIEKTLSGIVNNSIWNELAYFNLIQRLLPSIKGEDRPTYMDIVGGLYNFKNIIKLLEPTQIIFCGVEASKHFYNVLNDSSNFRIKQVEIENVKINGTYPRIFDLSYDDKIIKCFFIKHPSMGYSADLWSQIISDNS